MNRLVKHRKRMLLLVCIIGIFMTYASVDQATLESMSEFLTTQNKYIQPSGTLERISFHAAKDAESDETQLRNGFLLKRDNAKAIVFILNGFMCTMFETAFLRDLLFQDFHVVTFNPRGHDLLNSQELTKECEYCTFGRDEAYDVIAAVNYIKSRPELKDLPRIAYGFSMGAVAAIEAQAKNPDLFNFMILDCPYDRSKNVIKKGLENIKFSIFGYSFALPGRTLLEKYAFHPYIQSILKTLLKTVANMDATSINTYIYPVNPINSIKKVSVPCFFIHCNNDEKVSVDAARNLFNNAAGYKRLWITAGRHHFDSIFFNPSKYRYKLIKFIEYNLNRSLIAKKQQKITIDKYN